MGLINKYTWRMLKEGTRYKKYQIYLVLLFLPPLVLMILRPFFVRFLVDDIVSEGKQKLLIPFLLLFVFTVILERLASFWLNCAHIKIANTVVQDEQIRLYNELQKSKLTYFFTNSTGDIITKILSDVQQIAPTMVLSFPVIIFNIFGLIAYLSVLFFLSWKLTLITILSIPLYFVSLHLFNRKLQEASSDERVHYSKVNESLREKVEGILTIKGLVKPEYFSKWFAHDVGQWIERRNNLYINHTAAQNITFLITAITPVIVLGYGGISVMKGSLTLGSLMGFFSYINWIYEPLNRINENLIELQTVEPLAQRIYEIIDYPQEPEEGGLEFATEYSLEYRDVSFAYKEEHILKGINIKIKQDERVALVGVSGSGKSTLINMLTQLYQPTVGEIIIGSHNISEYQLKQLRKNVKIIRQSDYLFNMSVQENVLLGDNFSEQELVNSFRLACADEFINLLPEKYETIVGERGSNLSDGQRQRICLARALIRNPKILVLDEATSALDSNVEERIFQKLKDCQQTVLLISHRLSTIQKADRIVVLHEGHIVSEGSHDDLIKHCPYYRNIVNTQMVGDLESVEQLA